MNFEYDDADRGHSHIMELLAVQCRSNKYGFKEGKTQRIDAIRQILQNSGYHEVLLPGAQIWRKDFSSPIDVIVSSHVDTVDSITSCSSSLSPEGYYRGTYDNAGTNSAAVIAMLEGDIPENVVFSFTSDEETGRCNGAKQTLEYARNLGNEPICIALDVTYEGYDDGNIFSVENLSSGHKKNEDQDFLNKVANAALALESEGIRTCTFVKLHKNAVPDAFPKEYVAKGTGWFDEAEAYSNEHAKSFSLCLPCEGNMHGNSGVKVRQPEFEGYINALESVIYSLTNTHEQLIEAKRMENATLSSRLIEMLKKEEEQEKERGSYKNYSGYSSRMASERFWDEYDDDEADYRAYNASYGVYDSDSYSSLYDPGMYPSFDDYIGAVIDDIYDFACGYEPDEVDLFVEDISENVPTDVIEYYGGIDNFQSFVREMFETEFMNDEEMEESEEYENSRNSLKYDEDGFEYDENSVKLFQTSADKVKQRIDELEEDRNIFTKEEKNLLIKYADAVNDAQTAIERVNSLAKIVEKSPQLVAKELSRIKNDIDILISESKEDLYAKDFEPYDEFDDDDFEY